MTHQNISTDAILLTKRGFGDGHFSICLLTSELGIIHAFAFGGQRLSKRFKGGLEYFQVFEAEIQKSSRQDQPVFNLSCIKNIKHRFDGVPSMLERYIAVSYVQELASMLLNPLEKSGKDSEKYFDALVNCIKRINGSNDKIKILDEVYDLSVSLYKSTGFIPDVVCTGSANTKLCRLEHFNSNVLERTPRSFSLLSGLYS
jgi:DNA repair protein RecO